jgi:hypothetical protein
MGTGPENLCVGLYLIRWRKYIGRWKSGQRNDEKDARSLFDIAIRHEVKEGQADARSQAPKNLRRIHWITVRILLCRE